MEKSSLTSPEDRGRSKAGVDFDFGAAKQPSVAGEWARC